MRSLVDNRLEHGLVDPVWDVPQHDRGANVETSSDLLNADSILVLPSLSSKWAHVVIMATAATEIVVAQQVDRGRPVLTNYPNVGRASGGWRRVVKNSICFISEVIVTPPPTPKSSEHVVGFIMAIVPWCNRLPKGILGKEDTPKLDTLQQKSASSIERLDIPNAYSIVPSTPKAVEEVDNGICSSRVEKFNVKHGNVWVGIGCKRIQVSCCAAVVSKGRTHLEQPE